MVKESNEDNFSFKKSENTKKYTEIIKNIGKLSSKRNEIIERHFFELKNYNLDDLEDRDAKIIRIIGKEITHPSSFLASSLGFNRATWNKKYLGILSKFGLDRKIKYQTIGNMYAFEKLKFLIIKYFETHS